MAVQTFTLRDYQDEAHAAIVRAYQEGKRRLLLVLATGMGKTVIFATLPRKLDLKPDDVVVVLAHRDELIEQTVDKLRTANPTACIAIERSAECAPPGAHMIAASIQTLRADRLENFFRRFHNRIAVLIIDEAHHACAASYRAVIDKAAAMRPDLLLVGVTATPNRPDGVGLNTIFEDIVIERSTKWGIENGYLVPLGCYRVATSTTLDVNALDTKSASGDFVESRLATQIDTPERNASILAAYTQHTLGKKALVFCASIQHAQHLSEAFNAAGVATAYASGATPKRERRAIVARFRCGELRVIANYGLWLEGFDIPDAEVCIMARPTKSTIVFSQAIGRILRPIEETARFLAHGTTPEERRHAIARSQKPYGIVLDIVDQTKRHSLITMPTLWGLPPQLSLQGIPLETVEQRYRQLAALVPEAARAATSYEQIVTALTEVSVFRVVPIDPLVRRYGHMTWRPVDAGSFRLTLPPRLVGRNLSGQPIDNFRRLLHHEIELARRRGVENPRLVAYEILNVDPESVEELYEQLHIRENMLGSYEVEIVTNGNARKLSTVEDLREAFIRAERWIVNNRRQGTQAVLLDARWRNRPVSPAQRALLTTRYRVPKHCVPKTQGEASLLINQLQERDAYERAS